MCSKSNVNEALKGMTGTAGGSVATVATVTAHKIRQTRAAYYLVDVREQVELDVTPFPDADIHVTLGGLVQDDCAWVAWATQGAAVGEKTIVLVCPAGHRATLAAQTILAHHPATKVRVLQHGLVGWENIAAVSPDFMVVLGLGDSSEKLSLSLAACAAATEMHSTVVLVLMSDGVNWFLKADSPKLSTVQEKLPECANVETVSHGEPFKPCKAMLSKFLSSGGIILACTTCIKSRNYDFKTDMMDCIHSMQMPDLVRMMGDAKGGCLQFM